MTVKNAKNRSPQIGEGSHVGDFKSQSRSLGTSPGAGSEHGTYQVRVSGENSDQPNTSFSGQNSNAAIPGKIISQLIDENEKQLAYHEQQVELIKQRIRELKQIPEKFADIEHKQ